MKAHFIIPLVVYPFDILFSLGETDEEVKVVMEEYGLDTEGYFDDPLRQGRCTMYQQGQTFVRVKHFPHEPLIFNYLQHEIFHAVVYIMDRVGMKLDMFNSDEAYAYLIGYITEQVYKKINEVKDRAFQEEEVPINWVKTIQMEDQKMEQLKQQAERV